MKRLTAIFLLTAIVICVPIACSEDEEKDPNDALVCMTGIPKSGGTDRELIRCCTRKEALAGSNVSAGGLKRVENYKSISLTPVNDCSECQ